MSAIESVTGMVAFIFLYNLVQYPRGLRPGRTCTLSVVLVLGIVLVFEAT
jgi:hypothetical protein